MTRRTWWHHSFYPPSLLVPGSNALRCRGQRFQIKFDLINLRRLYFLLYWFVLVLFCVFYIWPFLVFVLCCGLLCSTLKTWRETKESVFINVSLERSTLTVSLFLLLFDWHSKTNVSACFSGLKNKSKFISFSTTVIYKDPFFFVRFGVFFSISVMISLLNWLLFDKCLNRWIINLRLRTFTGPHYDFISPWCVGCLILWVL